MNRANPQRGSAMLVTMIIISSLLAGAAVLVSMQLASNRSSDLTRTGLEATYCAEAGLDDRTAGRDRELRELEHRARRLQQRLSVLAGAGVARLARSLRHRQWCRARTSRSSSATTTTSSRRRRTIRLHDSDLRVFIVSRCTKYGETIKEVEELVEYSGGGQNYRTQQGLGRYGGGNNN